MLNEKCWKCKRDKEQIRKEHDVYHRRWICYHCFFELRGKLKDMEHSRDYHKNKYNKVFGNRADLNKFIGQLKGSITSLGHSLESIKKEMKKIKC